LDRSQGGARRVVRQAGQQMRPHADEPRLRMPVSGRTHGRPRRGLSARPRRSPLPIRPPLLLSRRQRAGSNTSMGFPSGSSIYQSARAVCRRLPRARTAVVHAGVVNHNRLLLRARGLREQDRAGRKHQQSAKPRGFAVHRTSLLDVETARSGFTNGRGRPQHRRKRDARIIAHGKDAPSRELIDRFQAFGEGGILPDSGDGSSACGWAHAHHAIRTSRSVLRYSRNTLAGSRREARRAGR
jgi:hypothetical protein